MNPVRKAALGGALVLSTLAGGALGAALLGGSANAQTGTSTTTPAATADSAPPAGAAHEPSQGGHTANGITEALLTGDAASQVTAAAQAAVPDGTIERVETDAEGAAYEAHMAKSDGSHVTVKLDASFKVTTVEAGGPRGG